MKKFKKLTSVLLALCMLVSSIPIYVTPADATYFSDVSTSDWHYDSVNYVYENNIMNGTEYNLFSPEDFTTRGMLVTMLHRMEGTPTATGMDFVDVPSWEYYASAIDWASANGIVNGYGDGYFGPEDYLYREQMVSVMYQYALLKGYDSSISGNMYIYSDCTKTSSYAVNAMNWALGLGLISGYSDGTIRPIDSISRAETATVLTRFCQMFVEDNSDKVTVTFDYNYNSTGTYQKVTTSIGEAISEPSDPYRSGYLFDGWYTDESAKTAYDFTSAVNEDITLYARWDQKSISDNDDNDSDDDQPANTVTVSFNMNYDGATDKVASQYVAINDVLEDFEQPTREDYLLLGWSTSESSASIYDFFDITSEITSDMVLYAQWMGTVDTDGDGLPDDYELTYGTDPYNVDTDGDGLNDFYEMIIFFYDPTLTDSDSNGILDGNEDFDSDGLTNINEINNGTNPAQTDTDFDGLNDNEEYSYGTDPTLYDTDGDGASDGAEIAIGSNPLVKETSFNAIESIVDENGKSLVSVELALSGEQVDTLSISPVYDESLFPESMPGYMCSPYDFNVDGTFDGTATISMAFDTSEVDSDATPTIYYFDEVNQELEALETTVVNGVATAKVSHFSTYVLINREVFEESFTWIDTFDADATYTSVEIVFVIDDSGSMTTNDKSNTRLSVASDLINDLPENSDIGIVKFASSTSMLTSSLTSDRDTAKNYLTTSYFSSSGNTYMYGAISSALNLYNSEDDDVFKIMVVLSDGATSDTSKHSTVVSTAQQKNVAIYTVGLGSSTSYFTSYLSPLATSTGGAFYTTSTADGLSAIYDNIGQKIDLTTDTDGDTICDYYEDNIVSFNGQKIELNKNLKDTDGDTLLDNEEIELDIQYSDDGSKVLVTGKMISNPAEIDSDFDGYTDNNDANPLIWDISDRDMAMCATMSYVTIPDGTEFDNMSNSLKSELNSELFGIASTDEFKGWYIEDTVYQSFFGLQAIAFRKDDNIIVAYRGTDELVDASTDITTYLFGTNAISDDAQSFINKVMNSHSNCNIYIAGHSLGGYLTYCAGVTAVKKNASIVKGIRTFNGLGLNLSEVFDATTLSKHSSIITNYSVNFDPVSKGLVGWTTYHVGETISYSKSEGAGLIGWHSMYTFLDNLQLYKRNISA